MSETVHYVGSATKIEVPTGKTIEDVAKDILEKKNIKKSSWHESNLECLRDDLYQEFFYHKKTDTLYFIDNKNLDADGEVIRAERRNDSVVDYELRYYNGGAGFNECLAEVFDKMVDKKR